ADHGEEFGEHGRYGHQPYLYESLIHVPLVVANAGRQETISRPVSLRSLAKTITGLADVPASFSGEDLLAGNAASTTDQWAISKVFAGGERRMSVRTGRRKYVRDADTDEFYDLRIDPDEQVNVLDERPEGVATFSDIVEQHVRTERERRIITDASAALQESV
ncbi:MAG: hypothetical protein ACQET5_16160, partial [Halobacteriota archaeon]